MRQFDLQQWLKEKRHKESPYGEKLDENGYADSLFDTRQGRCYLCGQRFEDTARHEIFYGTADRITSKAVGLWINVCPEHHTEIHQNVDGVCDRMHKAGQRVFEIVYPHEDFMTLFGKNYI